MTLTCLIVDDEELSIHHLAKYIGKIPFLELKRYFTDPTEAIAYLQDNPADLIFLDVEMPNFDIDGLDFVRIMGPEQHYIFTTAYPEYAMKGYDFDVIDFLHKPFSFERFSKAVQKARHIIYDCTDENAESPSGGFIFVRTEGRLQKVYFDEICWVESERNYISIYTDNDRINVLYSIKDIEEQLPSKRFARVHKSYIVAYGKIVFVEKEQLSVKRLNTTKTIPFGEIFKKSFLHAIEDKTLKKK